MNVKVKHRIVGGLVLVAILAIFLPLLFHNSKPSQNLKLSLKIPKTPPAPQVQFSMAGQGDVQPQHTAKVPVMANERAETLALQQTKTTAKPLAKKQPAKPAAPVLAKKAKRGSAPVLASATQESAALINANRKAKATSVSARNRMPEAWVVQVGTFSNTKNADRLVKRLRSKGYDVYTRQGRAGARRLVRVFVGPQIRKARAVSMQRILVSQFHLNGVIRKYTI